MFVAQCESLVILSLTFMCCWILAYSSSKSSGSFADVPGPVRPVPTKEGVGTRSHEEPGDRVPAVRCGGDVPRAVDPDDEGVRRRDGSRRNEGCRTGGISVLLSPGSSGAVGVKNMNASAGFQGFHTGFLVGFPVCLLVCLLVAS